MDSWITTTLRLLALATAALLLSFAGQMALPLSPWAALALPMGLAVAATVRFSAASGLSAAAGVSGALLATGHGFVQSLLSAAVVALVARLTATIFARLDFDPRLERPRDVASLVWVVLLAGALPATAALGLWQAATAGTAGWGVLFTGWVVIGLGMLGTAVAVLALDRGMLQVAQPDTRWLEPVLGLGAVLLMLGAVSQAAAATSAAATLALFVPLVVVGVLAQRGHIALAAAGLMATVLLALVQARTQTQTGTGPFVPGVLAGWLACALAMLLSTHATAAAWHARAQRSEWALDGSQLGVADWHLHGRRAFASAAWRSLTGHTAGDWDAQAWQARVHAEDRSPLAEAIAALSAGLDGRRQLELRMPHAGSWRWLEATLMVIERNSAGEPERLLATLSDAHPRHQAQEHQLMSVSLFQHLHEGLLITDADLRALDANPAYTQITGVARDELLGTVPSLLRPAPADPLARQQRAAMWAGLRDQGSWRGELLERRRSGEFCTLQATISTVRGPEQDLRYHVLVISDITEQTQQREQLERQAHFDELTRLPNRARLSTLLDEAMQAADRDGYLLVVCYLDLDRFKPVNDRYGHAAGDRLLAELATRLRSALRSRENWVDTAARLGGDEFVLLLRAGTLEEARLAVERALRVVSQPYLVDPLQEPVRITASMGATVYPIDSSDADTLLRHADHAMYGAKQSGRNGYLFFDPEHRRRTEERVMAIGRVQDALDRQEFVLHYQPKVDMRSGRVQGFEALLRWDHPQQGLIAPLQFLPLIENTGLSSRIGDWVIAQALDHLAQWRRGGLDISVSVNVSARHLQEPDFALRLSELLARHREPLAPYLEIEMLETTAHADVETTSALLARCQGIGVRFALDDFGTGYSTLTYLKRLPVDVLKIDRSFVHHMLVDSQDRAIVEGVIGLARTFGCTVVAEGVESPAQARTLLEMGCTIGQGTGIAAPMPSEQVARWVREYKGMFALVPAESPPLAALASPGLPASDGLGAPKPAAAPQRPPGSLA